MQDIREAVADAAGPDRNPKDDLRRIALGASAMLAATTLVLAYIDTPPDWAAQHQGFADHRRGAFTVALSIFVLPAVAGLVVLLRPGPFALRRKAFFWSAGLLCAITTVVDLGGLGASFFTFENARSAVLPALPAWDWFDGALEWIPGEDLLFYWAAVFLTLLVYIWGADGWLEVHSSDHHTDRTWPCWHGDRWDLSMGRHEAVATGIGLALIAVAVGLQRWANPAASVPSYAIYLVLATVVPSLVLARVVWKHVNWHVFSVVSIYMLAISFIFEVSLALPFRWWGFRDEAMIGIRIEEWWGLPLEQILLYLSNTWLIVLFYEVVLIWQARRAGQGPPPVSRGEAAVEALDAALDGFSGASGPDAERRA